MPKVLILSDSHGWREEIEIIKERHQHEVDAMIHCGDSELAYDSDELNGFHKVRGNMDFDVQFPTELQVQSGSLHFLVVHGHLHQTNSTLMNVKYRAEELGANVVCFGHSHVPGVEKVDQILFINPGSIHLPRAQFPGSYAILEADNNLEKLDVKFYTKDGQEITKLAYQGSLNS